MRGLRWFPLLAAAALGAALWLQLPTPSARAQGAVGEAEAPGAGDPWALPEPGSCSPRGGLLRPGTVSEDATAAPFQTGDVFEVDRLEVLRGYLPAFLWSQRDRFFFEGMRLEIGPCFRDYASPEFYQLATGKFRGQAKLDENGGLVDYGAGLPFAPDTVAADDPDVGMKWFWNAQQRYQAAGFFGKFRLTDLLGRVGRAEPFTGEMFKVIVSHRSDRAADDFEAPGARGNHWVAGGLFFTPFNARENSWRQYRNVENMTSEKRTDDLHAYLPQWRRVRRINSANLEGLYMPSFSVGVVPNQQLVAGSGSADAGGIVAGGAVGGLGGTIQTKRSGYEGLEFRPNLYRDVRLLGLHDVLTPLNVVSPMYPDAEDRDFGPWGLSFANDRWDLRRALVIGANLEEGFSSDDVSGLQLYLDLQTLQPLYMATFDGDGEMTNVGVYAGRWSEDREGYRPWPDDPERPIRVIDSVGAAFANLAESGSWRRESWDNVSTPPEDKTVKRMTSTGELTKRR